MTTKYTGYSTILATVILVACVVTSCKSKKTNVDAETKAAISMKAFQLEVKPVLLDTTRYGSDRFEAKKVRVSGDTLFIDTEYSGGCKDHVFTARHNGNYMKSMPPQLNLYVDHQGNGDGCRELIRETIAFDLKSCRVGKSGTLILLINADRANKVTYTY
jgi:hypothetical protein